MDTNQEHLERILLAGLTRTIDFVKFAETKNAALLAFASGWALAITAAISSQKLDAFTMVGLQVARALLVIAIVIVVWSFRPKLRPEKLGDQTGNLLYFGEIASKDGATLRAEIETRYLGRQYLEENYFLDLSGQVIANSRVAARKYRYFAVAMIAVIAALTIMLLPPLFQAGSAFFVNPAEPAVPAIAVQTPLHPAARQLPSPAHKQVPDAPPKAPYLPDKR